MKRAVCGFPVSILAILVVLSLAAGCNEQHKPYEHWQTLQKERAIAKTPKPELTDSGALPDANAKKEINVAQLYTNYCSSCHGAQGAGDGPAGAALNPPARNLTDVAWQDSVDDERIYNVIKNGGVSLGLAATMAPWGGIMKEDEIQAMVQYVRSLRGGAH